MTEYIIVDSHNNWLATGDFKTLKDAFRKAKQAHFYEEGTEMFAFKLKTLIPDVRV